MEAANIQNLFNSLREFSEVSVDLKGEKFIGLTLNWKYEKREVHLSMQDILGKHYNVFNIQHQVNCRVHHTLAIHSNVEQLCNKQSKKICPS